MSIKITKEDVIWNYAGTILNIGMSIFVLPFVLRMLKTEELGVWYIFGSIAALVNLLDFGFSPSIMRNIIYAWSGARRLLKEGTPILGNANTPNYELVEKLIRASKRIYLVIAMLAGLVLGILGTPYIYKVVETDTINILIAWGIYSLGVIINLYYSYWNPLLKGVGAIKEANQALVISRVLYLIFTIFGLLLGGGLIWLSLMYLISGFIMRILSKKYFQKLYHSQNSYKSDLKDIKELLKIIWPNARKQGLVTLGAWLITRSTTLITSYFFGLEITAQFGLSLQLFSFVGSFSSLLFSSYAPEITSAKINGSNDRFIELFGRSITLQWIISIIGCFGVIFFGPILLNLIGSNSMLLPTPLLILLSVILFLEWNHTTFSTLITFSNRVPFLASSLLSGISIVVISFGTAIFTNLGISGLIVSQGLIQLLYNNWYWPRVICKENKISIIELAEIGFGDLLKSLKA